MIPYGDQILDHYRNPRNEGSLPAPDIRHEDVNPLCGDRVRIEMSLADGESVQEARFRADGCIINQAACSILTEMIKGWDLTAIENLPPDQFLQTLGVKLRPSRIQCALLPFDIVQTQIKAYRRARA